MILFCIGLALGFVGGLFLACLSFAARYPQP